MKTLLMLFSLVSVSASAQSLWPPDSISERGADTTIRFLAGMEMKGRGSYTKEAWIAAKYIQARFESAGLYSFPGSDFSIPFAQSGKAGDKNAPVDSATGLLYNVVGVLPGKSRPSKVVIFSAHYDHVGYNEVEIFPGANDNASGTTALLLLADYFSKRADNAVSLLFCAFGGEEMGLLGSTAFVDQLVADSVVAVVNIEMIGFGGFGKDRMIITGAQASDFATIFRDGLPRNFRLVADRNPRELFFRSDNYPFAKRGIPAHSIMTSDDSERCYHQSCDNLSRIDPAQMTRTIRAIAAATQGLVDGSRTPRRIKIRKR